jgi:parallel beta helix pectate lyase-like protein
MNWAGRPMKAGWVLTVAFIAAALAGCGYAMPSSYQQEVAARSSGTTYYVDASRGSDSAPGTSPATAWRTLARVDRGHYRGGQAVLLHGGQRFAGTIGLDASNLVGASRTQPFWIGSYGPGRATIQAPRGQDGLRAANVAGVRVSRVDLVGGGAHRCQASVFGQGAAGIHFEAAHLHGTLDQGIAVDHVDVSRFCDGIAIGSADGDSRISHVRVTSVTAHDNRETGVWTYDQGQAQHSIRHVTVTRTRAYRNGGRGGIVLFGVDRGTVSDSVAFANSRKETGGVGIWAFDSNRIRITHDTSYANGSAAIKKDGDGFDLDRGVSNSVMAHNISHDNGGVGYLVCSCAHYARFYSMRNNTVRDNVSRNDGSSGQPSLYVLGGEPMTGIDIAHNRVSSSVGSGPLVKVGAYGRPYVGLRVRDNSFVARNGKPLLQLDPKHAKRLALEGNRWRASGGPFSVRWGHGLFRSQRAWRAATGAEAVRASP